MPGIPWHRHFTPSGNNLRGFSELFKVLPLGGQFGQKVSEMRKVLEHQQIDSGHDPERTVWVLIEYSLHYSVVGFLLNFASIRRNSFLCSS